MIDRKRKSNVFPSKSMKFTLLKTLIIKNENPSVFDLRSKRISSCSFLNAEDILFGGDIPSEMKTFFQGLLLKLKENSLSLSSQEVFLLRKILFISYLESVGIENIPSLLKGYEQDADLILKETPSLQAKRLKDIDVSKPMELLAPFLEAKDNVAFANALFDAPLEWTPLSKMFFATPLCLLDEGGEREETLLQNEFDYLTVRSDECAKKKHDCLLSLSKNASSKAERGYYFDLLKRHWTFVEDFLFYPISARKGIALLNPFYWLYLQQNILDPSGAAYKINKPEGSFSPLEEMPLRDIYSVKQEKEAINFTYYPKIISKTTFDLLNEETKKEARLFIFGLPE